MIRFFLLISFFISNVVFAAEYDFVVANGRIECGQGTCSIIENDLIYTFAIDTDEGKAILDGCGFEDPCSVVGRMDGDGNIIWIESVAKASMANDSHDAIKNQNSSQSSIFSEFRGYKWGQKLDMNSGNFESKYVVNNYSAEVVFYKRDENLSLGNVKLISVFYYPLNDKFNKAQLSWHDNENFDVGREVVEILNKEIGPAEVTSEADGFYIQKNRLKFSFKLMAENQSYIGKLFIEVDSGGNKGTF